MGHLLRCLRHRQSAQQGVIRSRCLDVQFPVLRSGRASAASADCRHSHPDAAASTPATERLCTMPRLIALMYCCFTLNEFTLTQAK